MPTEPSIVPTQLKMLSPSGKAEIPASALVCGERGNEGRGFSTRRLCRSRGMREATRLERGRPGCGPVRAGFAAWTPRGSPGIHTHGREAGMHTTHHERHELALQPAGGERLGRGGGGFHSPTTHAPRTPGKKPVQTFSVSSSEDVRGRDRGEPTMGTRTFGQPPHCQRRRLLLRQPSRQPVVQQWQPSRSCSFLAFIKRTPLFSHCFSRKVQKPGRTLARGDAATMKVANRRVLRKRPRSRIDARATGCLCRESASR